MRARPRGGGGVGPSSGGSAGLSRGRATAARIRFAALRSADGSREDPEEQRTHGGDAKRRGRRGREDVEDGRTAVSHVTAATGRAVSEPHLARPPVSRVWAENEQAVVGGAAAGHWRAMVARCCSPRVSRGHEVHVRVRRAARRELRPRPWRHRPSSALGHAAGRHADAGMWMQTEGDADVEVQGKLRPWPWQPSSA